MKQKCILILLIAVLAALPAKAQNDTIPLKTINISFSPLSLIQDGMQTDIEFRRKNRTHYIGVSPRFYFDSYSKEFFGVGSGFSYKILLDRKLDDSFSPYFMGMSEYTHYKFYATRYPELPDKYSAGSFRISLVTGFQLILADALLLDIYAGYGFAYSENTSDTENGHSGMYEHQYSGIYIPVGFRFGITL